MQIQYSPEQQKISEKLRIPLERLGELDRAIAWLIREDLETPDLILRVFRERKDLMEIERLYIVNEVVGAMAIMEYDLEKNCSSCRNNINAQ
ncbi:MAG: hypothetical protein ACFFG0_03715 [Candidatus Thorarchaeota archaeon]